MTKPNITPDRISSARELAHLAVNNSAELTKPQLGEVILDIVALARAEGDRADRAEARVKELTRELQIAKSEGEIEYAIRYELEGKVEESKALKKKLEAFTIPVRCRLCGYENKKDLGGMMHIAEIQITAAQPTKDPTP